MTRIGKITAMALALLVLLLSAGNACHAFSLKDFLKKHENAVVFITTYNQQGDRMGRGSGFFINADGDFITNRHVLEGAVSATLETADGNKYAFARLLAFKPQYDLALASVSNATSPLPHLEIAPVNPEKGERVIVLGSPRGIKFSVSEGIVSGIHTFPNSEYPQIDIKGTYVHFTAPISPGSSGGPVLNEAGQVVGVSTWTMALRNSQNINFAVPAEAIRDLIAARQEQNAVTDKPKPAGPLEKPRVGVIVTYGPNLVKQITSEERRKQITEAVEEALANEFRPTRFNLKVSKDTMPSFLSYWKTIDNSGKPPAGDDVDKSTLLGFGEQNKFDYVVFAAIDLVQVKTANSRYSAGAAVEVELDLRIANIARRDYAYSRISTQINSDVSGKIWIFSTADVAKPTLEAVNLMLRSFKREFSVDQII